jgi:heme oxygenase
MADLRAATWPAHQSLERRVDIGSRFANPSSYRRHLELMWGFTAGFEARFDATLLNGTRLDDYASRRKGSLLERDLRALGSTPSEIAALPICTELPECGDSSAAFGCLYVIEGSTLGGRSLLPLVRSRLGVDATNGAAFLTSYGEEIPNMWRRFGEALEAWCNTAARRTCAAAAAAATFARLGDWLSGGVIDAAPTRVR